LAHHGGKLVFGGRRYKEENSKFEYRNSKQMSEIFLNIRNFKIFVLDFFDLRVANLGAVRYKTKLLWVNWKSLFVCIRRWCGRRSWSC
jgi:hypothetical protein